MHRSSTMDKSNTRYKSKTIYTSIIRYKIKHQLKIKHQAQLKHHCINQAIPGVLICVWCLIYTVMFDLCLVFNFHQTPDMDLMVMKLSVPSPAPQSSSPVLCCRDEHESDAVCFLLNHPHYNTHTHRKYCSITYRSLVVYL